MAYDGTQVLDYLARTHQTSLVTDREKHLIGLAVTITRGCRVCTRGRIEKARAAGMDDNLLNALVDLVSSINAGVAAATAREAFRMADAASTEACGALCSPEVSAGRGNTSSGCTSTRCRCFPTPFKRGISCISPLKREQLGYKASDILSEIADIQIARCSMPLEFARDGDLLCQFRAGDERPPGRQGFACSASPPIHYPPISSR